MAKTVKMADIAAKLGVSTVTVSKALSGQKGVSDEVRGQIIRLAEELGYQRPAGKEEKKRSFNIGVIVSASYIEKYATFYWELYQELNTASVERNCFVMLEILTVSDEKAMIPPKLLKENKIDGLIILGGLKPNYLKMIRDHYATPTVYMDFYDSEIKEDSVISNSFYGTYHLTNYLYEKGHTKIAFVGTILATNSITDRYLGYTKAVIEHHGQVRADWLILDRDQERNNFDTFELPADMPTAFVCNCDMTASRLIKTLRAAGYRVPKDISVVGFDDYLFPGLCDIPLTTYAVNMEGMADSGIRLLIKKMNGKETSQGMHMVEGHFIERSSVKAVDEKKTNVYH